MGVYIEPGYKVGRLTVRELVVDGNANQRISDRRLPMAETILTPVKAIRAKCLDCCSDQPGEVRLCPSENCPLWPYRMGHNPNRKGMGGKFSSSCTESASIGEKIAEEICESWF